MIVRGWRVADAAQLVPMIRQCLEETAEVGADWAPTDGNVDKLLKLGLKWSAAGDPTLVAETDDGDLVAYTLWGELPSELDVRSRTCAALGTFVADTYRRRGVARGLRERALAVAKAKGYDRVLGSTYDPGGHDSATAVGFKPIGSLVEKRL